MKPLLRALGMFALVALIWLGLVKAYHWSRTQECEQPLEELLSKKAPRDDVLVALGMPFEVAKPAQAEEYARRWAGLGGSFASRVRDSSETLVYLDGEFVSFVHLGADARVMAFTCIGN